jgi:hypothetical protein
MGFAASSESDPGGCSRRSSETEIGIGEDLC